MNEVNKQFVLFLSINNILFYLFINLGFIGVVLRGQRLDEYGRVSKELDIAGALEYERHFFQNEPAYRYEQKTRINILFLRLRFFL